jgi:hypothetical protein
MALLEEWEEKTHCIKDIGSICPKLNKHIYIIIIITKKQQ